MLVGAFEIHHGIGAAVALAPDAGEAGKMLADPPARRRGSSRNRTRRRGCRRPSAIRWRCTRARGSARAAPVAYQASAPSCSKASAMRLLTRSSLRISTEPSPFSRTNTVIGTPQARWREITQSGLLSTMPLMRFSPAAGTQRVTLMASSARWRSVSSGAASSVVLSPRLRGRRRRGGGVGHGATTVFTDPAPPHPAPSAPTSPRWGEVKQNGLSIAMNHCGVLRKISGFFERQECGYWCLSRPRAISMPASIKRLDDGLVGVALVALVGEHALAGEARRLRR